jgi:1-acyl-sn-glycerol-3-phosphate acyltransferase
MGPVRLSDYISNADIGTLIDEAVDRLRQGSHLVMFPEGTRTVPGQPLDFHRGAATIAVTAQADCLPILIRCTPTTLTKAEPWYHIPRRRVLFEVKVLERIPADQIQADSESTRHAVIALTERLRQLYNSRQSDNG